MSSRDICSVRSFQGKGIDKLPPILPFVPIQHVDGGVEELLKVLKARPSLLLHRETLVQIPIPKEGVRVRGRKGTVS